MLEIDYNERPSYEYQFMIGRNLGRVDVSLIFAKKVLNGELRYLRFISENPSAEIPEKLQSADRNFILECSDSGKEFIDLCEFLLRYRTLSIGSLAERVFRESEFWHGCMI